MAKTVFGVFSERQNADAAVKDLIEAGIPKGQIHLERITREDHGSIELTEDERQRFVDAVGEKATLLRVKISDDESSKVRAIMMRQGGATFLRTTLEDSAGSPDDGLDLELLEPGSVAQQEFEEHFLIEYAPQGERFEDLLPAYEFGYHFGAEQGFENMWKDWNQVDRDAKARWETDHPGTWERFQLAIEEGWATAPARLTGASLY